MSPCLDQMMRQGARWEGWGLPAQMCLGIKYPAGSPRWCLEVPYVWQAPRLVRDPFLLLVQSEDWRTPRKGSQGSLTKGWGLCLMDEMQVQRVAQVARSERLSLHDQVWPCSDNHLLFPLLRSGPWILGIAPPPAGRRRSLNSQGPWAIPATLAHRLSFLLSMGPFNRMCFLGKC